MKTVKLPESKRLYAYCDETVFEGVDGETFGTGMLLTEAPVAESLIAKSMAALRADPDCDALDDKTLARGYFHASEDSKNAHSYLCRAIANELEGYFCYEHTRSGKSHFVRYRNDPNASLQPQGTT